MRIPAVHVALLLSVTPTLAPAEVRPLPREQWPHTVAAAVPLIVGVMTPAQLSIVRGTSRENLFMLQGEWGEDIETLLGLDEGNTALRADTCPAGCTKDAATLRLMEAAWRALTR